MAGIVVMSYLLYPEQSAKPQDGVVPGCFPASAAMHYTFTL